MSAIEDRLRQKAHDLQGLVAKYAAAKAERAEVCRGDCEWPRGDGECSYCYRERMALAAIEATAAEEDDRG